MNNKSKNLGRIRGKGVEMVTIDEFFRLESSLSECLQREVLKPIHESIVHELWSNSLKGKKGWFANDIATLNIISKERRLAIQMWQEIKGCITTELDTNIAMFKITFCKTHNLDWDAECWFCQYIPCCKKCPLQPCSLIDINSTYGQVLDFSLPVEVRIKACDKIINALKED